VAVPTHSDPAVDVTGAGPSAPAAVLPGVPASWVTPVVAPPGPAELPGDDEARRLLARLRVPDLAVDDVLRGRPERGTAAWATLEARHHELVTASKPACWPPVPDDGTPGERWLSLWAFLAALPHALALDAARGVPEDITWHTLGDIGDNVRGNLLHGRWGFDPFWLTYHVRGRIYRLGRLQFNVGAATVDSGPDAPFGVGDPVLGVHIPMAGPLTPEACDDAFARGRAFFGRYVSDRHAPVGTCRSWLLDPQLAEVLPADSNIVRFQRRFTLTEGFALPGDNAVLHFVFGQPHADPNDLVPASTLQEAIVERLLAGEHFWVRRGWLRL
jgi:hypothetical protein